MRTILSLSVGQVACTELSLTAKWIAIESGAFVNDGSMKENDAVSIDCEI